MKPITTNAEPPPQQPAALIINQALQQAAAHHQAGQYTEAEELYRGILQIEPGHPDANHNLGLMAMQLGKAEMGLPYLQAAWESDPSVGQYWLTMTECLLEMGYAEDAGLLIEKALSHGMDSPQAQQLLMRAKDAQANKARPADTGEAEKQPLQSNKPASPRAPQSGKNISKSKPAKLAKKSALRKEKEPDFQEINALVSLFARGHYAEAATLAQAMTERFPVHGFGWKMLGAAHKMMGRHTDALAAMQKAAALSPEDAEVHNNMGSTLKDMGYMDEAEASYRQALKIKSDYAEAHYNLGNTIKGLGRLDEAVNSYRMALQIKPDLAEVRCNLGSTLQVMGRLEDAEVSYRQALRIKPDFAQAHCNLGNVLNELGRLKEAEASCRRALQIKPDFAQAHSNLGNIFSAWGKLDEAAAHFKACLEIDQEDSLGTRLLLARLGLEPMPARASEAQLNNLYIERSQSWDRGKTYRGHELVAQALKKQQPNQKLDILDAGCGTGLVGMLVHGLANRLDGVDMSPAMLRKAHEKGIYSRLDQGDMVSFMANHPNSYDAILCAATLIHFGDLMPAFDAAATSLRDDGIFVFTLFPNNSELSSQEIVVAENVGFANGGCYAHRSSYVRRVAEAIGFAVNMIDTEIHEYDNKAMPIMGLVVVLRRRSRLTPQASPL